MGEYAKSKPHLKLFARVSAINSMLIDSQNRIIKYLRVSVTERCNLRCLYCDGQQKPSGLLTHSDETRKHGEGSRSVGALSFEEFLFIISAFVDLGLSRIRITGGEPLIRDGLPAFIQNIRAVGITDISLTTNGFLLQRYASELAGAGVNRINISLDSLKADRYGYITGGGDIDRVLKGIELVRGLFSPVKINVVAIKGFNDDEIAEFCEFAAGKNVIVRFIEFMPIGNSPDWQKKGITGEEILDIIEKRYRCKALPKDENSGPARKYLLSNGAEIGLISPISECFCNECDRLRLTADGKLRACLLADEEISLKESVKKQDLKEVKALIQKAVQLKQPRHQLADNAYFQRAMRRIGG